MRLRTKRKLQADYPFRLGTFAESLDKMIFKKTRRWECHVLRDIAF